MEYPYKTTKIVNKRRFPTYQLHARTINESLPPEKVLIICVLETFAWLRGRLSQYDSIPDELCLPEPEEYENFDLGMLRSFQLALGFTLDVVYSEKNGLWAFCLSEDDMGANPGTPQERKPVLGRNFETYISYRIAAKYVEIGFQTICSEPEDTKEICEVFRPSVVKALYRNKNIGLRHILNITDSSIAITSSKEMQRIKEAVNDPHRELPIVIITQPAAIEKLPELPDIELPNATDLLYGMPAGPDRFSATLKLNTERMGIKIISPLRTEDETSATNMTVERDIPPNMIVPDTVDADRIATSAASFAFVCKASDDMFGMIRSNFFQDLEKGDILILYKDANDIFRFSDLSGKIEETECAIRYGLSLYPMRRNIDWGDILFTYDARIMEYHNRRLEELTSQEENSLLKAEVEELHKKLKNLEGQTRDANSSVFELRRQSKQITALQQELERKISAISMLEKSVSDLKNTARRMLPSLEFYKEKSRAAARFPVSKDDNARWIETDFADTIFLHSNAISSLKKYPRTVNMSVLCDGIFFLHGYGLYRQSRITDDKFRLYAEEFGWQVQGCGKEALNMFQDDYSVPMEDGRRQLGYHIKYGVSPQHWIRIYFYYDEQIQRVVIGYMPDHLPTISDKT